ncbi:MAG: carbonic anhydrase family protein [Planctomycetota bacterium]|nr:MAG: carbonic anhydrase family protein [Planctomycetota bacterium]
MKNSCCAATLLALICIPGCGEHHAAGQGHWGYEGDHGPAHWGALDAGFSACADGMSQSPIDLVTGAAVQEDLPDLTFDYAFTPLDIVNNGHTIQVNVASGQSLMIGADTFGLAQFHFHGPSEHTLDGQHAAMELHLVHEDASGNIAVAGMMIRRHAGRVSGCRRSGAVGRGGALDHDLRQGAFPRASGRARDGIDRPLVRDPDRGAQVRRIGLDGLRCEKQARDEVVARPRVRQVDYQAAFHAAPCRPLFTLSHCETGVSERTERGPAEPIERPAAREREKTARLVERWAPGRHDCRMDGTRDPDCTLCRHFYITWRPPRTRGCRAYGFESESYPSVAVLRESGTACRQFEPKHAPTEENAARPRGAP